MWILGVLFPTRYQKVDGLLEQADNNIIDIGSQTASSLARKLMIFAAGVLFVILVWYIVAWTYNTFFAVSIFFPDPISSFERLTGFFTTDYLILGQSIAKHTQVSLMRWVRGFVIAFAIGMVLGIILGSNQKLYQFGIVPVTILQLIPGLAWLPVTILLFGFGEKSAVFIIAITVISPIAINVANGLRRVPVVNMRVSAMSGRTVFEKFSEVLIPFAALDILSGLRIGMANGWRMLISAEMVVGVAVGLGYAIQITTGYLDYVTAFACIVLICIIGLVIDKVILASLEQYARRRLGVDD